MLRDIVLSLIQADLFMYFNKNAEYQALRKFTTIKDEAFEH